MTEHFNVQAAKMHHRHIIVLLGLLVAFSMVGVWLLMQKSLASQHRSTRLMRNAEHPPDGIFQMHRDQEERNPGSRVKELGTSKSVTSSSLEDENFVPFEYDPKLDLYPWHHIHYGHWRRRVIDPGDVLAERSIQAGPEHWEISSVVTRAIKELQRRTGDRRYRDELCLGGKYRYIPGAGVQYEMYFHDADAKPQPDLGHDPRKGVAINSGAEKDRTTTNAESTATLAPLQQKVRTYFHTVRLQRKIGRFNVQYAGLSGGRTKKFPVVKIIVPYYNSPLVLQRVLTRFRQLVMEKLEDIELVIVRFSSGLPAKKANDMLEDKDIVETMVTTANAALSGQHPRIKLIEADGDFSLAAGWLRGAYAEETSDDAIVFLSHVDLVYGKDFLQRCRANAKPGERVYYPVVFSTYNPDIVYGVIKQKVIPVLNNYDQKKLIHRDFGYWLEEEFIVSCQYLSDLKGVSGSMTTQLSSSLPQRIYERHLKNPLDVVRIPDSDLVQVYRRVECTRDMGRRDFNKCLMTKARSEASKLGWGLWVYKNMGDTDEVDKFLKIVRTYQRT